MDLTPIAKSIFNNDLYATQVTGIRIEHVDAQTAICSLRLNDSHRNAKGAVMGGVIFTLADFAFAIAANTGSLIQSLNQTTSKSQLSTLNPQLQWVSSSSTIHFLSAPKGDTLTATTSIVRQGRSQAVVQITVCDSQQRNVALVTTSGTKSEPKTENQEPGTEM